MGVSGCGKTTVGRALAAALGLGVPRRRRAPPGRQRREDVRRASRSTTPTGRPGSQRSARTSRPAPRAAPGPSSRAPPSRRRTAPRSRPTPRTGGSSTCAGDYALIAARLGGRSGHFMKEALLRSQFEALEEPARRAHPGRGPGAGCIGISRIRRRPRPAMTPGPATRRILAAAALRGRRPCRRRGGRAASGSAAGIVASLPRLDGAAAAPRASRRPVRRHARRPRRPDRGRLQPDRRRARDGLAPRAGPVLPDGSPQAPGRGRAGRALRAGGAAPGQGGADARIPAARARGPGAGEPGAAGPPRGLCRRA